MSEDLSLSLSLSLCLSLSLFLSLHDELALAFYCEYRSVLEGGTGVRI